MDDARALLDSLMGQTRNEKKAKRRKGQAGEGFKHESVCKLYLAGFCPEHEELFHNTKRDLGLCPKTHFEISKEEFNAHPDKKRYQAAYELQLLNHLSAILRRCDEWTARERQKHEEALQNQRQYAQKLPNAEVKNMKDMASKAISDAEELASKGDFEGSKRLLASAAEHEKKATELEESTSVFPEICELCGERKGSEKRSAFKHEAGKVHQGILLLQKMYADLKKKEENGELKADQDIIAEERDYKERHDKEIRAKEREARDREARQRREKEEREARERREKEREIQARERREKEEKEREERQRREKEEKERVARERRDRECETREHNDRRRRRHEDSYQDQHADDGRGSRRRRRGSNDQGDPGQGSNTASEEDRQKMRLIQEQFMDLLVESGAVTCEVTYRELEDILGDKEQWRACPERNRRELAGEFMFTNLLANSGAVTPDSTYEGLYDVLGDKEHWKACPEARRREIATEWIEMRKAQDGGRHKDRDRSEGDVPRRSLDRNAGEERRSRKRRRAAADRGDSHGGQQADGQEHRYKIRALEKQFMYMLMNSDAVNPRSTYEELEAILGRKEEWQACPEGSRRELAKEYIDVKKRLGS